MKMESSSAHIETAAGEWRLRRYTAADKSLWDNFVVRARNATFLFYRDYMDYHADRFVDASLIAELRGQVRALLPANITSAGTLQSHGGLTYGGWILPERHLDGADVLALFRTLREWGHAEGLASLDYRPLPQIYARRPSQEDLYALFRLGAKISACGLSSTIDCREPHQLNTLRKRHLKKALALQPVITEENDPQRFHKLLTDCLNERHGRAPVHTARELQLLMSRFPRNIRIFTISLPGGEPLAGVCMYLTDTVAHTQYIASSAQGRDLNMLTPLLTHLIDRFGTDHRYFDFGISTEERGAILNEGLLRQKTSFGASATVYQQFILEF